jgi:hypothetical protein
MASTGVAACVDAGNVGQSDKTQNVRMSSQRLSCDMSKVFSKEGIISWQALKNGVVMGL